MRSTDKTFKPFMDLLEAFGDDGRLGKRQQARAREIRTKSLARGFTVPSQDDEVYPMISATKTKGVR